MWDNPRQLNLVANALVGGALLLFAFAALQALLHSDPVTRKEYAGLYGAKAMAVYDWR